MTTIRITGWLVAMSLVAVSLSWTVQDSSTPGERVSSTETFASPAKIAATAQDGLDSGGSQPLELTKGLADFRMPCKDCHSHLGAPAEEPVQQGQGPHAHVVLEHGGNNRCFNCHHPDSDNYGSFVGYDGSVIPLEDMDPRPKMPVTAETLARPHVLCMD